MDWFTSDEHFNHENILRKFVFRPFPTVVAMNREIIDRHNARVSPGDTVYHLGDFKVSSAGQNFQGILKQLNGSHVFIQGNHDKRNGVPAHLDCALMRTFGQTVLLAHRPKDVEELRAQGLKFDFAFVGHVHATWKFSPGMANVGVDAWDFFPVHAKQIFKAYKGWIRDFPDLYRGSWGKA